jgi:hypothetical protein
MSPPQDPRVTLRLQSDPAWIGLAIAGTLVASNALFVTLFQGSRLSPALGVLPGMTLAVFVGSALAHAARRRGGTLSLESNRFRMELRAADARHEVLDLGAPIAAVILCGAHDGRRMLVLSQREEPTVVIEEGRGTRAPEGEVWRARTLRADLDAVAISAARSASAPTRSRRRRSPRCCGRSSGSFSTPWWARCSRPRPSPWGRRLGQRARRATGPGRFSDAIAILTIVIVNAFIGFYQERKAEKALDALLKLSAARCKVRRGRRVCTSTRMQLVPGDLVLLEAGDKVPGRPAAGHRDRAADRGGRAHRREHPGREARRRRARPKRRPWATR